MKKEALQESPTETFLINLPLLTEEQWQNKWQDINFTKVFPKYAVAIVSPAVRHFFPEENRKIMVERATKTLMETSWKPVEQGLYFARAHRNVSVDENLNTFNTFDQPKERIIQKSKREILIRSIIGSIILVDESLEDKTHINTLFARSYEDFTSDKRNTLRQHILGLLINDSSLRCYIKKHNLDTENNFDWDRQTAKLFLFLDSLKRTRISLSTHFCEDLSFYSLPTIDEFVNHALEHVYTISTISRNKTDVVKFLIQLDLLREKGYFDNSPLSHQVQRNIEDLRTTYHTKSR